MDAFDADVLIYAASPGHPFGARLRTLVLAGGGTGSVLLLPEVLSKPLRESPDGSETRELVALLARLELRPVDRETAQLATTYAAAHRLRVPDSTHLATAGRAGADRVLTNNRRDFPITFPDIAVTYPEMIDPA